MITLSRLVDASSAAQEGERQLADSLSLTAVVDTALCVGAGGSSGSLADKPILKNAKGRLVIPASQLKGRLRHECEKLARSLGWPVCESPAAERMCPQRAGLSETEEASFHRRDYRLKETPGEAYSQTQSHCIICQIFGNPAIPAKLQFSDLICTTPKEAIPEVLRPGVSINRRRRTAEEQKLYFLETSPANAGLEFEGSLQFQSVWQHLDQSRESVPFAKALVLSGLKHIYALGGSKSTGLGWLHWKLDAEEFANLEAAWDWLGKAQRDLEKENDTADGGLE